MQKIIDAVAKLTKPNKAQRRIGELAAKASRSKGEEKELLLLCKAEQMEQKTRALTAQAAAIAKGREKTEAAAARAAENHRKILWGVAAVAAIKKDQSLLGAILVELSDKDKEEALQLLKI